MKFHRQAPFLVLLLLVGVTVASVIPSKRICIQVLSGDIVCGPRIDYQPTTLEHVDDAGIAKAGSTAKRAGVQPPAPIQALRELVHSSHVGHPESAENMPYSHELNEESTSTRADYRQPTMSDPIEATFMPTIVSSLYKARMSPCDTAAMEAMFGPSTIPALPVNLNTLSDPVLSVPVPLLSPPTPQPPLPPYEPTNGKEQGLETTKYAPTSGKMVAADLGNHKVSVNSANTAHQLEMKEMMTQLQQEVVAHRAEIERVLDEVAQMRLEVGYLKLHVDVLQRSRIVE